MVRYFPLLVIIVKAEEESYGATEEEWNSVLVLEESLIRIELDAQVRAVLDESVPMINVSPLWIIVLM
ncbi:MAG: hypothetical protein AB1638_12630 [Nitrospirota bacterium]